MSPKLGLRGAFNKCIFWLKTSYTIPKKRLRLEMAPKKVTGIYRFPGNRKPRKTRKTEFFLEAKMGKKC
jgi:hypothetical protein